MCPASVLGFGTCYAFHLCPDIMASYPGDPGQGQHLRPEAADPRSPKRRRKEEDEESIGMDGVTALLWVAIRTEIMWMRRMRRVRDPVL